MRRLVSHDLPHSSLAQPDDRWGERPIAVIQVRAALRETLGPGEQ